MAKIEFISLIRASIFIENALGVIMCKYFRCGVRYLETRKIEFFPLN